MMKFLLAVALLCGAHAAEKSVRTKPLLGSAKAAETVNASAVLKASVSTGAKMVHDAYVALDQPGMTPPQEMAMFSAQFPNGNVCGEDKNPKHGSCAHSCMNNCRKSFATCNKMYKNCLKTGKWELLKAKAKSKKQAPGAPADADDTGVHSTMAGVGYGEEGGADDGADGGFLLELSSTSAKAAEATPAPTEAEGATPAPTEAAGATPAPTEAAGATPAPTEAAGATVGDQDGDEIANEIDADANGDGETDPDKIDENGNGIDDRAESDVDENGVVDEDKIDENANGIDDRAEASPDNPNPDDDGNGIVDNAIEAVTGPTREEIAKAVGDAVDEAKDAIVAKVADALVGGEGGGDGGAGCTGGQVPVPDGSGGCQDAPDAPVAPECTGGQVPDSNGGCEDCPDGQVPDDNGVCEDCPEGQVPDGDGGCICPEGQVPDGDGGCSEDANANGIPDEDEFLVTSAKVEGPLDDAKTALEAASAAVDAAIQERDGSASSTGGSNSPDDQTDPDGDLDGDGIPNAEDDDIDGDGVANSEDADPTDPSVQTDTDGDGIDDKVDNDIDGDGVANSEDADPTDPSVTLAKKATTPTDNGPEVPDYLKADLDNDSGGDYYGATLLELSAAPKKNAVAKPPVTLKAKVSTGAKMVHDAYVALDQPGMTPPQEMAMFSAQFPNGNVCGEDKNPKHGSCAHSCMNNCRKSFATCNKMYKNCLKTGKWELLKAKSKKQAPGAPADADDTGVHSTMAGVGYGEEGGADDGADGGF